MREWRGEEFGIEVLVPKTPASDASAEVLLVEIWNGL